MNRDNSEFVGANDQSGKSPSGYVTVDSLVDPTSPRSSPPPVLNPPSSSSSSYSDSSSIGTITVSSSDSVDVGNWKASEDAGMFSTLFDKYLTREKGDEEILYCMSDPILRSSHRLSEYLESDVLMGMLDENSVAERLRIFGTNRRLPPLTNSYWHFWLQAINDKMMLLLCFAASLSLILALAFGDHPEIEWIEGGAILLSVLVVTNVAAANDFMKERKFIDLQVKREIVCTVMRNGKPVRVNTCDLSVGDLVQLSAGDEVPADLVLVKVAGKDGLIVDESSMTGESDLLTKVPIEGVLEAYKAHKASGQELKLHDLPSSVIVGGCLISDGSGYGLVMAVGQYTMIGATYNALAMDTEFTTLQKKLNGLSTAISKLGLGVGAAIFLSLVIQYWIMYAFLEEKPSGSDIAREHFKFLTDAGIIVVVAVPEGLPLAVVISLAFSVHKMLKDGNYVRRLQACETMGTATDICSDKTGTLTENKMTVVESWFPFAPTKTSNTEVNSALLHEYVLVPVCVNSTATLKLDEATNTMVTVGNPSEGALLQFAATFEVDKTKTLNEHLGPGHSNKLMEVPFNSLRKCMTTVVKHPTDHHKIRVYVKGASEKILELCTSKTDSDGNPVSMTDSEKDDLNSNVIEAWARQSLRTLTLAHADLVKVDGWDAKNDATGLFGCEEQLTLDAIFGVKDPVREGVGEAIKKCRDAKIRVRMITGDNIVAATSIGMETGIYEQRLGHRVVLGPEFTRNIGGIICQRCQTKACPCPRTKAERKEAIAKAKAAAGEGDDSDARGGCCRRKKKSSHSSSNSNSDEEEGQTHGVNPVRVDVVGNLEVMKEYADTLVIMARSQPSDKYALVCGLKQLGRIVAVTGDGTNDVPALKLANVGLAMGITGKDVAKEASDIVLLQDDFGGIVRACLWGRNIYSSVEKFLVFQLTVNVVAVVTAFSSAFFLRSEALTAIQLLWLNLIMDTFAALALATDSPDEEKLLHSPPQDPKRGLVTKLIWKSIISSCIYQIFISMFILFSGHCWIPETSFLTDAELNQIHVGGTLECPTCIEEFPAYPEYSMYSECSWMGGQTTRAGARYFVFSAIENYKEAWILDRRIGASRHLTVLFNSFVFMQIFNLLLCKNYEMKSINIFYGVMENKIWLAVFFVIIVGQVVQVTWGSIVLTVHPDGLTWQQWLISLSFGFGQIVWGVAFRFVPENLFFFLGEGGKKEVGIHHGYQRAITNYPRSTLGSDRITRRTTTTNNRLTSIRASGR